MDGFSDRYLSSLLEVTEEEIRNARIGFRQQEMTHIMENIIFNELMIRECSVDIGIVYGNEKNAKGRTLRSRGKSTSLQPPVARRPISSLPTHWEQRKSNH